jgi:signal transduction histidine kinase
MGIPLVSLVAMTFAATSIVVALAMFLLVLWQAPTRRTNQLMALFMFEVVCWAAMSLLLRMSGLARQDATPFFYGIILGIAFNGLLLFTVVSHYAGLWKYRWAPVISLVGLGYYLATLPLLFSGALYPGFAITPDGAIKFRFEPLGYVAFGVAYLFYVVSLAILWRYRSGPARALLTGSIVTAVGVLTSIHPVLSQYSFAIMSAGISTVLFAHAILRENLFNPLSLLNIELTKANVELSRLSGDLKAANEQLIQASHLKSNFLASMSHELRTPLNSILGYSDLLLQTAYGPLNEMQEDRVGIVVRNARNLLELINEILDLSKIEAGQVQLTLQTLDLKSVLDECLTMFEPLAGKKGLTLHHQIASDLAPVIADRGRVLQIVNNLVSNAIKFTPSGKVTIDARTAEPAHKLPPDIPPSEAGWVLVTVEDSGIGIAQTDQAIIFDEFRQVDDSLTREYEGTGLGLAITRRLVRMMNGEVWVESETSVGSKFYVVLPIASKEDRDSGVELAVRSSAPDQDKGASGRVAKKDRP